MSENKQLNEDYAKGFGAALALLGVVVFVGLGVYIYKGGKISEINPFDQSQTERADESRPRLFNFHLETQKK